LRARFDVIVVAELKDRPLREFACRFSARLWSAECASIAGSGYVKFEVSGPEQLCEDCRHRAPVGIARRAVVEMEISELGGNQVKVTLKGRLDSFGVSRIETRFLGALVPGGHNAIVDLAQTEFVASMGIRMFMTAARTLHTKNARIVLYAPQALVREVFESVSLDDIITICDTEAEAIAVLGSS
jgi:anti-anti-sigma factor